MHPCTVDILMHVEDNRFSACHKKWTWTVGSSLMDAVTPWDMGAVTPEDNVIAWYIGTVASWSMKNLY